MVLDFEDLDDFLVDEEFAEEVLFGVGQVPVMAIFDRAHFSVDDMAPDITTRKPMLTCKEEDVADYEQDDPVVVRAVNYVILEKVPDGTGMSEIHLKRA